MKLKTDLDLPEAYRTQANHWKAKYFEMREEVVKANKGIRRLKYKLDLIKKEEGGCMKDLIRSWKILADQYTEKAGNATNAYTAERLFASADTLIVCADQLHRKVTEQDDTPRKK